MLIERSFEVAAVNRTQMDRSRDHKGDLSPLTQGEGPRRRLYFFYFAAS
jgi:hypothetical protein